MQVIWGKSEPEYFCEWGWTLICRFARRAQITGLAETTRCADTRSEHARSTTSSARMRNV
jgi:hypothetical protein